MPVPLDRVYMVDPRCCGCSVIRVRPFEWDVEIQFDNDVTIEHVQVDLVGGQRDWHRRLRRRLRRAWSILRGREWVFGFELMDPRAVDELIEALRKAKSDAWADLM